MVGDCCQYCKVSRSILGFYLLDASYQRWPSLPPWDNKKMSPLIPKILWNLGGGPTPWPKWPSSTFEGYMYILRGVIIWPLPTPPFLPVHTVNGILKAKILEWFAVSFSNIIYWRLMAGGKGGNRGWDGWITSPTQGTWVQANLVKDREAGVLQSMGSQRVRHDLVTEQQLPHLSARNPGNWEVIPLRESGFIFICTSPISLDMEFFLLSLPIWSGCLFHPLVRSS